MSVAVAIVAAMSAAELAPRALPRVLSESSESVGPSVPTGAVVAREIVERAVGELPALTSLRERKRLFAATWLTGPRSANRSSLVSVKMSNLKKVYELPAVAEAAGVVGYALRRSGTRLARQLMTLLTSTDRRAE
jgi:hypothetical protein